MNYDGLDKAYWNTQIERVEQLRSKIAERATAQPGRVIPDDTDLAIGTGRRLSLTVMFLDISAFTQRRSATSDEQELMLRILNLFITEMIRVVEDYGGNVEKNTGDGLMAYFEDETGDAGDNSTKRAVACSLTMHATNEYLVSPILRATGVPPLQFRITMDYGPVTIARIGAARRFNANVAIGNTANFAAHMLRQVKAGDIAVGSLAWGRLPELWRTLWTELSPVATGWVFGETTVPYPLYLYTGRWAKLL